jgi:hypothetical protein
MSIEFNADDFHHVASLSQRNGEEGRLRQSGHPRTPPGTKAARARLLSY